METITDAVSKQEEKGILLLENLCNWIKSGKKNRSPLTNYNGMGRSNKERLIKDAESYIQLKDKLTLCDGASTQASAYRYKMIRIETDFKQLCKYGEDEE